MTTDPTDPRDLLDEIKETPLSEIDPVVARKALARVLRNKNTVPIEVARFGSAI